MMKIEKDLAATDLNKYKKDELISLIEQCYKYQKFKIDVAVKKIDSSFKESTVRNYFTGVKSYLKTNVKSPHLTHRACEIIDNLVLTCYPTLQPSKEDVARIYTMRKRRQRQNPSPTPITPVEPPKYTEQIPPQYGVKLQNENTIKLFSSKDACKAYIDCYKEFVAVNNIDLVKVDFETVEI